jgi:hypothetical protein
MNLDEAAVLTAARADGIDLRPAASASWLTAQGHLNPLVRHHAPTDVVDALDEVHASLGGDRRALARLHNAPIRTGYTIGATQRVEIDDVGHFTSARLTTLGCYPAGASFGFSLDLYRSLIETWKERAASVFTRRWTADFDFAGGRRARRAYEDALLDLLVPVFTGRPLVRIASPDGDAGAAALTLRSIVA